MKKRIIALMISAVLCVSLLPYEVFANLQSPIEGISPNSIVGHTEGLSGINPRVELKFQEPDPSSLPEGGAINGSDIHGEDSVVPGITSKDDHHYQVEIQEQPAGRSLKWPEDVPKQLSKLGSAPGQTETKGIQVEKLESGRLYKMSIISYHYHMYPDGEKAPKPGWAKRTATPAPTVYVLTDFDTRMVGKDGGIEVTWEDTGDPNIKYEIGYIQGDYTGKSLEAIIGDNKGNEIQYITSDEIKENAESYREKETERNRLSYTIKNNITQGKVHSAYVVSTTEKIGGTHILQNWDTPKVVAAIPQISLTVLDVSKDKIRLVWDKKLSNIPNLEEMKIEEYSPGSKRSETIATLYGQSGVSIGSYEYRKPAPGTTYQLILKSKDAEGKLIESKSGSEAYLPDAQKTKPTTPVIPKPIGPNTELLKKEEFLVPGDSLQDVSDIDFWKSDHTFHVNMKKPPTINFVWSAYKKDLSLQYDIWVTDDIDIITTEIKPIAVASFAGGENADKILRNKEKDEIVGFRWTLEEYYNSKMEKGPLVPNKVYYIKIVANNGVETSRPAIVTIMFNADGEMFAPPTISKPPLQLDSGNIGKTSITIEWLEKWYEVMAKYPDSYPTKAEQKKAGEWNAKVYTSGPAIAFVHQEGADEHILKQDVDVTRLRKVVGGDAKFDEKYLERAVRLGDNVEYDYKFIPYQEILQGLETHNKTTGDSIKVEEYIELLMREESDPEQDGDGWKKISPKTVVGDEKLEWKQHTQDGLKPNTSYMFFVRPYTRDYDKTKLKASLPTWVIGTTLPDGEMPEGKPTVPVLSLNGKGDTHISVEWEYNDAFDYEIVYSRLEDPNTATSWPFEISTEIGDPTYVESGRKAVVTITGLFPETTYNIWIHAKQKKGVGVSAWSNPVTTKTLSLGTPTSPAGLGVASYQSILEIGKDFKPVDSNHITVEWQRLAADLDLDKTTQDSQRVQKEYRYVIELADNPEFIDKQSVTVGKDTVGSKVGNAEILSRSMVYFDSLIANRPYYVRAKTILIAHDKENDRQIVKESEYTQFVRIITKPSQSEYDGGDKMNEVIYPNKIEETYDGTTWIYQILDTQKVINEMVTGNQFRYVVPVRKYKDRYDAKFRIIRIPQPVVTTLLNRRMELEIRTNILSIQIPAKALEAHMIGTSADGMVEFMFETLSANDLYGMGNGYEYGFLSRPEKMSITVKGPRGVTALNKIDALLNIKINMPYQVDYMNKNLGGYTYDTLEGIWKKGNHQFDKISMQLGYTSGTIGTYAVYEKTRVPTAQESITQSMRNVVKQHDVVGLGTKYTPYMKVSTLEYINIMLGIAEKKSQIKPDMYPTKEEVYRAKNAGIYVNELGTTLTQEAAISGVVRLYELINGISVRSKTNENVSLVTEAYRSNIQKAYTIGLISNISPQQPITYGELFNLIEQVIE